MSRRLVLSLIPACFCALSPAIDLHLVPRPQMAKALDGQPWRRPARVRVRVPERLAGVRDHFRVAAGALGLLAHNDMEFVDKAADADLVAAVDPGLAPDAYRLQVQAGGVRIEASALKGVARATATLLQLIGRRQGEAIPALEIRDKPDCVYRSFMVDVGRNAHLWGIGAKPQKSR